jgi:diaminopimelate epimerase
VFAPFKGYGMQFTKYQALGNDYLVIQPSNAGEVLPPEDIQRICDRHYGVGSDGILFGPLAVPDCDFGLRIFNPDGSEAEKSGNGLRIFSRYLWDRGLVQGDEFTIHTMGGAVRSRILENGRLVLVEMGRASFDSQLIPVSGPRREVIGETLLVEGMELKFCAVTLGNPHCVILKEAISTEEACRFGPQIETDARFPKRTNVQFMKILDGANIQIEIWERGAGYTLASGSSSCAAASTAYRLGLCGPQIAVHMPGGKLDISIDPDWTVHMTGPVARVCSGTIELEDQTVHKIKHK